MTSLALAFALDGTLEKQRGSCLVENQSEILTTFDCKSEGCQAGLPYVFYLRMDILLFGGI